MRKHLIVEGFDGTGKDTLIEAIRGLFPDHTLHPRASTSLGGPVSELADWVDDDLAHLDRDDCPAYIYNRHPLISEPIYGPYREINRGVAKRFDDPDWLANRRRIMAANSTLIICEPHFSIVDATLKRQGRQAHMPGVFENRLTLYTAYTRLVWPGLHMRYNWTTATPAALARLIKMENSNNGNR